MIGVVEPKRSSSNSGKWVAIGLVVLGLVAAGVGWKFRLFDSEAPPTPATRPAAGQRG